MKPKFRPVKRGKNRWCGPAAISILTGLDTDRAATCIRAITGQPYVKSSQTWAVLRVLRSRGLSVLPGFLRGRIRDYLKCEQTHLIVYDNHFAVVSKGRYCCGAINSGKPIGISTALCPETPPSQSVTLSPKALNPTTIVYMITRNRSLAMPLFKDLPVGAKFRQMTLDGEWVKTSLTRARYNQSGCSNVTFDGNQKVRDPEKPKLRKVPLCDLNKGVKVSLTPDGPLDHEIIGMGHYRYAIRDGEVSVISYVYIPEPEPVTKPLGEWAVGSRVLIGSRAYKVANATRYVKVTNEGWASYRPSGAPATEIPSDE